MDATQKLIELFKQFPGIGPRQAKRFVYFLLTRNNGYTQEIAKLIGQVRSEVTSCTECLRFFTRTNDGQATCPVCRDTTRDSSVLMIVPHDVDFENIERTKSFTGYYFILGGTIPILEKNPEQKIRQRELLEIVEKRIGTNLKEIIIALNYTPEGENTLTYLEHLLLSFSEKYNIKLSALGRGLSTGTELEYSDSETIKNALRNRQNYTT